MDFIVDWVREMYCRDILTELEIMVENPTPSLRRAEIDTLNLRGDMNLENDIASLSITPQPQPGLEPSLQESLDISFVLEVSDTGRYAIRDAPYMHHNLCGIWITLKDVTDILYSAATKRASRELGRRLLASLPYPHTWGVTAESLHAIEYSWTGTDNYHLMAGGPTDKFIVRFCFASFFTIRTSSSKTNGYMGHWHQVQELSFIAVAVDAIGPLRKHEHFQRDTFLEQPSKYPIAERGWLLKFLEGYRHAPMDMCLAIVIDRKARITCSDPPSPNSLGCLVGLRDKTKS